jgi:hypothetical protein
MKLIMTTRGHDTLTDAHGRSSALGALDLEAKRHALKVATTTLQVRA